MSETGLYYVPASDDIFNEVKQAAMKLWKEVDTDGDKYGYATEKINRIKDITNVQDNLMYIVAMFDIQNQRKLSNMLTFEANQAIRDRMIDGGQPESLIPF